MAKRRKPSANTKTGFTASLLAAAADFLSPEQLLSVASAIEAPADVKRSVLAAMSQEAASLPAGMTGEQQVAGGEKVGAGSLSPEISTGSPVVAALIDALSGGALGAATDDVRNDAISALLAELRPDLLPQHAEQPLKGSPFAPGSIRTLRPISAPPIEVLETEKPLTEQLREVMASAPIADAMRPPTDDDDDDFEDVISEDGIGPMPGTHRTPPPVTPPPVTPPITPPPIVVTGGPAESPATPAPSIADEVRDATPEQQPVADSTLRRKTAAKKKAAKRKPTHSPWASLARSMSSRVAGPLGPAIVDAFTAVARAREKVREFNERDIIEDAWEDDVVETTPAPKPKVADASATVIRDTPAPSPEVMAARAEAAEALVSLGHSHADANARVQSAAAAHPESADVTTLIRAAVQRSKGTPPTPASAPPAASTPTASASPVPQTASGTNPPPAGGPPLASVSPPSGGRPVPPVGSSGTPASGTGTPPAGPPSPPSTPVPPSPAGPPGGGGRWSLAGAIRRFGKRFKSPRLRRAGAALKGLARPGALRTAAARMAASGGLAGVAGKALGGAMGGVAKAGGALAGALGGVGKVAGVLAGPWGILVGLIAAPLIDAFANVATAVLKFGDNVNESNRHLARYNGSIAMGFYRLQMGDFFREMQLGRRTQESTIALTDSIDEDRDAWAQFNADVGNLKNNTGRAFTELSTLLGKAYDAMPDWRIPLKQFGLPFDMPIGPKAAINQLDEFMKAVADAAERIQKMKWPEWLGGETQEQYEARIKKEAADKALRDKSLPFAMLDGVRGGAVRPAFVGPRPIRQPINPLWEQVGH